MTALARPRQRAQRPPATLLIGAGLALSVCLLPLAYLLVRAAGAGPALWRLLARPRTAQILWRSVVLMATVTAASVALSLPLAWLLERSDLPGRHFWRMLLALPLVIPSYVTGFVVVAALGPRGLLQQALGGAVGAQRFPTIYGLPGAWLAVLLACYPYTLLTLQAAFRGLDDRLTEAARSLGHGPWSVFLRVTLPQLGPSLAAGSLLVSLYALRDLGAVSLLRYETLTWAIYLQYQTAMDRTTAAGLALLPVGLAVMLLGLELRSRQIGARYDTGARGARLRRRVRLGKWRWPALVFCALVTAIALLLPLGVLGYWLGRALRQDALSLVPWQSMVHSLRISALAALFTAAAAAPIALLEVRYPGRFPRLVERITYVSFGLPGIVIALALVFFSATYARALYQTHALLLLAYLTLFLPQAVGSIRSSLLQLSPRLEEAARSLGRSPLETMISVTLPLMLPGIVTGGALVFLTAMKELPATLLLAPIGVRTLATSIWSASSEGLYGSAALSSLLLVLLSGPPMALLSLGEGSHTP